MYNFRILVVGPPRSGKSTLTAQLNCIIRDKLFGRSKLTLVTFDVGVKLPPDLWRNFDFVIITFDLTATAGDEATIGRAWDLVCEALQQDPNKSCAKLCIVGTRWDRIPQNPLDIAVSVYRHAREMSRRQHGLKVFPVSTVTGYGCTELSRYIATVLMPCSVSHPIIEAFSDYFRSLKVWLLDQAAQIIALPVPKNVNQSTPDPYELDDPTIRKLMQTPEAHAWDEALKHATMASRCTSHKITPELIVKYASPGEHDTMVYVRSRTQIPIPQPRYPHLSNWLVMDFIEGKMLLECWASLSWWMKLRIACTLRCYVKELRTLKGTRPGSVVDGMIEGHYLFDDQRCGPFTSATHFRLWCERVAHGGWVRWMTRTDLSPDLPLEYRKPPYPIMGVEWPLVFTHGDLNLSNVILSSNGVLWIIDWATGGFYPPWLETIGIKYSDCPASFEKYRGFIAGTYPEYETFWDWFMTDVHRGYSY